MADLLRSLGNSGIDHKALGRMLLALVNGGDALGGLRVGGSITCMVGRGGGIAQQADNRKSSDRRCGKELALLGKKART